MLARPLAPVTRDLHRLELTAPVCLRSTTAVVTPEDLLARCARGDEDAFAQFYDAMVDSVFGLARAVVRDAAMAEEITHDVLLEIWGKASEFDPSRGSARAWTATITRRRAIDVVRSEQSGRNREERTGSAIAPPTTDPVGEQVVDDDDRSRVRSALAHLSDLQRQAIDLAYFQGLTYREVSQALGVPLGTVKTRMRDGLRRLAGIVGPDDG
jgi:RNA polymerase sigma-70 factor, ECF subfamily